MAPRREPSRYSSQPAQGKCALEVSFVFVAQRFCLEQQGDLRDCVWNSVAGVEDHLVVGQRDRLVAPADPSIAHVQFTKHVDTIVSGRGFT